jgi:arylsulfatase A-like enzyme
MPKKPVANHEIDRLPRSILPIPDRGYRRFVAYDAKDPESRFPPIQAIRPPAGAPNVLVILLDDVGFGASSAFGGPCQTPNAERLARDGLRYTRFHTTALCSPTRAALLTGRNHHAVGMGGITEIATSAPGYSGMRPNSMAPLAEILRLNGYSTAQFGKCHEIPIWETSPAGPFDHWPTGSGFQHFFGFIGGETNQYFPTLYEGTTPVEPNKAPEDGYHLMPHMTDRAIAWIRQQKALTPDAPFFAYFAPGATHAPHQVPKEWVDRYRGKFDQGWDRLREETLERQKALGVVPPDAVLTERHSELPAWNDVDLQMKPVLARQMEIYAGFLEYADHHIGRLLDALGDLDILEDTVIYYIIGDNGASAEGGLQGTFNEIIAFNGQPDLETPEFLRAHLDEFGGPLAYNHYAASWAHAMNTPYQWTKQVASHWGGTRNGTIVHYPRGIRARGEVRSQFCHVVDVAPTILELANLPEPVQMHGVTQEPMHGTSMVYSFDDADAAERHDTQYFEMFGNRGIYHRGWTAVTKHRTPWAAQPDGSFDEDRWELYDGSKDWTQAKDLARQMPDKLRELQRLFLLEASRFNVFPLDDRSVERFNSDLAGRPTLVRGDSQLLFEGMGRLNENCVVNVKNKSHAVTADIVVPEVKPRDGVLICQGGVAGGWVFFVRNGRLTYGYNYLGLEQFVITADSPLSPGRHRVRLEFEYDGGGLGKGGRVTLRADGNKVGEGRIERTHGFIFSGDETTDVGQDTGSPVLSNEYRCGSNGFTGRVNWVQIDLGSDDHDHLISPDHRMRVAMMRQ